MLSNIQNRSDYLSSLIDSAHCLSGVPDGFHTPTAKIAQREYITPTGTATTVGYIVRPTLEYNVGYGLAGQMSTADSYRMKDFCYKFTDYAASVPVGYVTSNDPVMQELLDDVSIAPACTPSVVLNGGATTTVFYDSVALPMIGEIFPTRWPYQYVSPSIGYVAAVYSDSVNAFMTGTWKVRLYNSSVVTWRLTYGLTITYYDANYIIIGRVLSAASYYDVPAAAGIQIPEVTLIATSTSTKPVGALYFTIGFYCSHNSAAVTILTFNEEVCATKVLNTISMVGQDVVFDQWSSVRDIAVLSRDMDKVRVTGQSTLLTYIGANLQGGSISAGTVLDGSSWADRTKGLAMASSATNYNSGGLQNMPNTYSNQLNMGLYAVYRPQSLDMATKWLQISSEFDFSLPYHIILIKATDPTATHRLEVVTNIEAQTVSPLYTQDITPSNHAQLFDAFDRLCEFPCFSENPDHLANIKRLLSSAYSHRVAIARGIGMSIGNPVFGEVAARVMQALPDLPKNRKNKMAQAAQAAVNVISDRAISNLQKERSRNPKPKKNKGKKKERSLNPYR